MSGGGRCNFTNYYVEPEHFIGANQHFCKSALSRYPSWEFIGMVAAHKIPYHEREHGQLFCDDSAQDILTMLLAECTAAGVQVKLNAQIDSVQAIENGKNAKFELLTSKQLSKKKSKREKNPPIKPNCRKQATAVSHSWSPRADCLFQRWEPVVWDMNWRSNLGTR